MVQRIEMIFSGVMLVVFIIECRSCPTFDDKELLLKTGESLFQPCKCDEITDKDLELTWIGPYGNKILNHKPGTNPRVYTERESRSLNLYIPRISKSVAGQYKCIAEYDDVSFTSVLTLQSFDGVYFYSTQERQYLVKDTDSMVICQARGYKDPSISWYKGTDQLKKIENDDKYEKRKDGLLIRNVHNDDAGEYRCTASVYETGEKIERNIKVKVTTPPSISEIKLTPEENIVEGEFVTAECRGDAEPEPQYAWRKISEDKIISNTTKQDGNTLIFDNITNADRGVYECMAYNRAGNASMVIEIQVQIPPKIVRFENITTVEGATVQLSCAAYGRPAPNVTIYINGDNETDTSNILTDIKMGEDTSVYILSFLEVKRSYEGLYFCDANNSVGSDSQSAYIEVLYQPFFTEPMELVWGWRDKIVTLNCEHESKPPSKISWRFDSNEIPKVEQILINKHLADELKSNGHSTIINLALNKTSWFGTYECKATNAIGEATKLVSLREAFPPPEIENITITETTATSVTFSIDGPSYVDGPPVIGFTAEYDDKETYSRRSIHKNRTWAVNRPFKVEHLKPNTMYFFKFAAINEVGQGNWSDFVELETPAKSVPNPPEWIHYNAESGKLKLYWKIPESNGDPIDYYVLKYCIIENGTTLEEFCEEEVLTATEAVLTNLEFNSTYHIELIAHNSQGNSSTITYNIGPISESYFRHLSAEATIVVAVVVVIICIMIMDMILCCCRKQGLFASCYYRKNKKRKNIFNARDRKVLIKENNDSQTQVVTSKRNGDESNNEFGYNRPTGIITGKHSSV